MSVGMLLISVELFLMLCILLFIPGDYAGPCFIGFAIGEPLGAAALRIAGGIFTKIADIGADLMKIVFKIDRKSTRLNSSHSQISYAVFCLKKKNSFQKRHLHCDAYPVKLRVL